MPDASIFLVEDEALVRMSLASMVEELGHRVAAEAGTIKEAGAFAMTGVFDLAILDINIDGQFGSLNAGPCRLWRRQELCGGKLKTYSLSIQVF